MATLPNSPSTKSHSRKTKGRAYWQSHLQAWSQSGLTQTAYCSQQGISKSAFYNWKSKLKAETATVNDPPFVAVQVGAQPAYQMSELAKLSIQLTNGLSLRVPLTTDPALLLPWLETLSLHA